MAIQSFIKIYNVDMSSALDTDPTAYQTFNRFFTRALKPEKRPITDDNNAIVCPVDGTVSQYGSIKRNQIIQAKGRQFSVEELLGCSAADATDFVDGEFATLYLSPRDYHRIHSPINAQLVEMRHIPGKLFSVNAATTRTIPNLFARNERLITLFETSVGYMAVIMVGAIFVSSIETTWAGVINQTRQSNIRRWHYGAESGTNYTAHCGAEIGRFNMGSTVILLFQKNRIKWDTAIKNNSALQMGQKIAEQTV